MVQLLEAIDSSDADGSGTINLAEFKQVQKNAYAQQIVAHGTCFAWLSPGFRWLFRAFHGGFEGVGASSRR